MGYKITKTQHEISFHRVQRLHSVISDPVRPSWQATIQSISDQLKKQPIYIDF